MTDDRLPIRGDPNRMADICNDVGSTPVPQENIIDGYDESETTIKNEIRYGIRLGFLKNVDDEVVATEAGLDLANTYEGEERRAECFRQAIARHEGYSLIVEKLFRKPGIETVERRDVEKIIRINLEELGDDTRRRAATLFLDTMEAAGIGTSKKSYKQNPARIEIQHQDALKELLGIIDDENTNSNPDTSRNQSPPDRDTRTTPDTDGQIDEEETELKNNGDTTSIHSPSPENSASTTKNTRKPIANFQISLELDGSEDPSHIERLVGAVQRGLHPNYQSQSQSSLASNQENTEHPTDSETPNNSDTTPAATDAADNKEIPAQPSQSADFEESPECNAPPTTDQGSSDESTTDEPEGTKMDQDEEPEPKSDREPDSISETNEETTSEDSEPHSNLDDFG